MNRQKRDEREQRLTDLENRLREGDNQAENFPWSMEERRCRKQDTLRNNLHSHPDRPQPPDRTSTSAVLSRQQHIDAGTKKRMHTRGSSYILWVREGRGSGERSRPSFVF